jgi:hypothetical protein
LLVVAQSRETLRSWGMAGEIVKEKIKRVLQKNKNNLFNNKSRPVKSSTTKLKVG